MDIGLGLAQVGAFADPTLTRRMAAQAEAERYASLWVFDRLLAPVRPRTPYPGSADGALPIEQFQVLDPFVSLTIAAGATEQVRLGTNVLVAPYYPPVVLARLLAGIDQASAGRLVAGLGLGWSADEFAAVGAPQRDLAMRMEEVLETLRTVWYDDISEMATSRDEIAPSVIGVKPVQAHVPIVLAAYTPAGLERIARRGDGWTPAGVPVEVAGPMWASVLESAERYGRDTSAMKLIVRGNVTITDAPITADRPEFVGSIDQVRTDVERTAECGADELVLDLQGTTRSLDELFELAATLTASVAAVR